MATTATELVGGTVPLPTAFTLSVEDVDEQQQQQQRQEQEQEQGKSTATASIAGASREGESSWTSTEHIQRSLLGVTQSLPRGTANASSSNDKRRSNRPPPPTLASVLGYSSSVTLPLSRDETSASSTPEPVYVSSRNKSILVRPSTSTRSSATTSSNPWSTKSLSLGRSLSDRSLGSDSAPSTSSSSRRLSVFSNRTVADVGPKKVREDARQAAPSQSQPQQHHPQSHALSASMNSAYGSGASAHSYPERMGGPGSAGGFSSFSSPPNSGNSMQTRSPNPGGKASAMLGMSSGGAFSGDPYGGPASATQTFQSSHSDYDSGSKGMSAGKLTLKKAKSLFSSSKSTKSAESTAPLPSSPKSGSGLQAPGYPYGNPSLQHSKSYGSLVGNRGTPQANRTAPESDYRFPSSGNRGYPASSSGRGGGGGLGFEQSYAASPVRKASLPNIDPHRRTTPKIEEEEDCPVCLESLSIRLAGEKAHIVPNCGHKLHADCFEAAYGSPEEYGAGRDELDNLMGSARRQKKAPQGICGICRSEMRLGDPAESKQSKFAAISGQPGYSPNSPPLDTHKLNSISKRTIVPEKEGHSSLHDPSEDHEIVNAHQYLPAYMQHAALGAQRAGGTSHIPSHDRVQPKITVRAEHATIVRPSDPEKKVHLTCMVTVEVPSRIPGLDAATRSTKLRALPLSSGHGSSHSQSTILPNSGGAQSSVSQEPQHFQDRRESNATSHTQASDDFPTSPSASAFSSGIQQLPLPPGSQAPGMEKALSNATHLSAASNPSNTYTTPGTIDTSAFSTPHSVSASSFASPNVAGDGFAAINASSTTLTAAAEEEKAREAHGPFGQVFADLQERMADWKGHQPANFGSLRMYDSLNVKKDKNVREFVVYLFEEALLCVVDDKKKRSSTGSDKLRLKGRVFVKHMKQVEETSTLDTGLSLTINMEDDSLESFVILFSARNTLEVWRLQIQALIDHHRPPVPTAKAPSTHSSAAPTEKRDSVFSNNTSRSDVSRGTKATTAPSAAGSSKDARLHAPPEQAIPPLPSATAGNQTAAGRASQIDEIVASWTAPDPNAFVPLDLMLVISVPNTGSGGPSSSSLKLRLIRSTLDFVIHSVGPRARISIVTYTVGDAAHGCLRKTPWLATGRADGMRQLEQAVAEIAGESVDRHVEGLRTVDAKEQKTTVASAVNLALDIILQRQVKSATSGILLLNDGKDGAAKQQIDLTLVRADAAAIPIHSFGWGKGHDPSSLWLLSNHTRGTYTFVRDFYQLKDAIAGCVGGMLCVAVCALRLHLNVQERRWFKIRKVGGVSNAIVSSDGKDVDINIGDLRYGERKEMLVEIEMVSPRATDSRASRVAASSKLSRKASMTATDDFFMKSLGLDPHSLGELQQQDEFYDEIEDGMADDVPIFDCTASYRSPLDLPNAVSRLPYPTLLTTTVTPPTKDENGVEISAPVDTAGAVSDPGIVRRRMELLISDMMTRTLLLMSRRQDEAAQRLLAETVRITGAIIANIVPPNADEAQVSSEASQANYALKACMTDIESILAGCADRAEFDSVTRNFGAQQAVALRDQRAWTARTATEGLFFSREWTAVFGKRLAAAGF